ncbi:MAG: thioredoxin fold domain-containing protein [Planctomycetota bacterium]
MDLDEIQKLARAAKKPLFIDFETDWCVWCKRLDYYTYPDAEVRSWLNKFLLVKWNSDFDPKNVGQKFGLKGFPYIAIVDGEGKPIHSISGWKKASEFVTELKDAHQKWLQGSRPKQE